MNAIKKWEIFTSSHLIILNLFFIATLIYSYYSEDIGTSLIMAGIIFATLCIQGGIRLTALLMIRKIKEMQN